MEYFEAFLRLLNVHLMKICHTDSEEIFTFNCLRFLHVMSSFNLALKKDLNLKSKMVYVESVRSKYQRLNLGYHSLSIVEGHNFSSVD